MTDRGTWNTGSPPRVSPAEDFYPGHLQEAADPPYLEAALEQKEEQLVLAAQLGKALLEENEQLRAENKRLQERETHTLQETEQQQYWLVQRSEGREKEWECRAYELETSMRALQGEVERMQKAMLEAEKERDGIKQSLGEQNQSLREKLQQALQTERRLTAEVSNLTAECQDKALTEKWDAARILSLQEEVERASHHNLDLEQQLSSALQENEVLQSHMESRISRVLSLEKKSHELLEQLIQSQQDTEDARLLNRTLRSQVEELQEEIFLSDTGAQNSSLLSEMDQSLEKENWCSERQQVIMEIQSVLQELEACESATAPPCMMVAQSMLADLAQRLEDGTLANQASERSLAESFREESQSLKEKAERTLQLVIQERDEAITKKTAVEMELGRCRMELSSLNSQLLAAVQRKVQLSQELEAWQEDMQRVISEQVKNQQQREASARVEVRENNTHSDFIRLSKDRKSFFSLFRF